MQIKYLTQILYLRLITDEKQIEYLHFTNYWQDVDNISAFY